MDAEDTKRRSAEALSTAPQIHRLVRKYRAQLDERRKAQLVEPLGEVQAAFFGGAEAVPSEALQLLRCEPGWRDPSGGVGGQHDAVC